MQKCIRGSFFVGDYAIFSCETLNQHYHLRMLYIVLGSLLVIVLFVVILRKNSGASNHNAHDEAMWTGHSDTLDEDDKPASKD